MQHPKRTVLFLLICSAILAGCSPYGYVRLNYPSAPMVYLPDNIQTIALINRSQSSSDNKGKKLAESILTGEIAGLDKVASDECLNGVFDRINGYHDIECVFPSRTRYVGTGTRYTADLLNWDLVQGICDSSHADALLVLETFDHNSDIIGTTVLQQVGSIVNGNGPHMGVPNRVRMNVVAFWRLYDPKTRKIIDQFKKTTQIMVDGAGLPNLVPPDALAKTAYAAGQEYIERFLPSYYTVKRDMYKTAKGSGKNEFESAFRKTEVARWEEAIKQWKAVEQQGHPKSAGKACLNIAVSYEVLGQTDVALEWAQKAYSTYGDKLGRDYAKILLQRQQLE